MNRKKSEVNSQNGAFCFYKRPKLGVCSHYLSCYICIVMLLILYKTRINGFLIFLLYPSIVFSQISFPVFHQRKLWKRFRFFIKYFSYTCADQQLFAIQFADAKNRISWNGSSIILIMLTWWNSFKSCVYRDEAFCRSQPYFMTIVFNN